MKIVVAIDKFRGSLDAAEACRAVAEGLREERPDVAALLLPMADGGEGTASALGAAMGGTWIESRVKGPRIEREIDAGFVWVPDRRLAVVEMAAASGLHLLSEDERDPLRTTTFGTGQLLLEAVHRDAREIWLSVGGSATVDGGVGAATAMAWLFLDGEGQPIGLGGGELERIVRIEKPDGLDLPPVDVLCDVDNPLCGPEGAAPVFAPQKGADPATVDRLARGLENLADRVERSLGIRIRDLPGGGAAGGLAAGAHAFFGARLVPGIDRVVEATGLPSALEDAAWAITGEGRFDETSLRGKVVSGVLREARRRGIPVAVLAGSVEADEATWREAGIRTAAAIRPPGMPLDHAMARARELLRETARVFARDHLR